MADLKYFCLFIGYPYSGHSLVGSIIDAHPNAVISHELHIGRLVKKGFSKEKIFSMIILNSMNFARHGRTWNNYSYAIPDEWNGRFTNIKIIGDKKGSGNTEMFSRKNEILEIIDSSFGVPVKYVHVIRNPYDIISTLYRKRSISSPDKMDRSIDKCLQHIRKVEIISQKVKPEHWLDIYHEKFIANPEHTIMELFNFFELEVHPLFIENCKKILYKNPHKSRLDIVWTREEIEFVAGKLSGFEKFSSYAFDS